MGTPNRRSPLVPASLLRALCIGILAGCSEDQIATPIRPTTAMLVLNTITTGGNPDPDGYRLLLDNASFAQLAPQEERELPLPPGQHTLLLTDVAANCQPVGENLKTISVIAGQRLGMTFQLDCPVLSSIDIAIATTGVSLDPDGYMLSRDGSLLQQVSLADHAHLSEVRPGTYHFRLWSVAGNCVVAGGADRVLPVAEGQTLSISFDVSCAPRTEDTPGEKLVISSREATGWDANLEIMNPDGSGRQRLTDNAGDEAVPELSPDGSTILFLDWSGNNRKLVLLDRAERQESPLATPGVERAVWSPDGTQILFARHGSLFLMQADGSGEKGLTNGSDDRDPYWSPDGGQIAFTRSHDLYLVSADGSLLRRLAVDRAAGPWSPDGRSVVATSLTGGVCFYYYSYCYFTNTHSPTDLVILDVVSGVETGLTSSSSVPEWSPAWSRDGQRVYFISAPTGNPDIYAISLTTLAVENVTRSTAREEWVSVGVVGPPVSASRARGTGIRRP